MAEKELSRSRFAPQTGIAQPSSRVYTINNNPSYQSPSSLKQIQHHSSSRVSHNMKLLVDSPNINVPGSPFGLHCSRKNHNISKDVGPQNSKQSGRSSFIQMDKSSFRQMDRSSFIQMDKSNFVELGRSRNEPREQRKVEYMQNVQSLELGRRYSRERGRKVEDPQIENGRKNSMPSLQQEQPWRKKLSASSQYVRQLNPPKKHEFVEKKEQSSSLLDGIRKFLGLPATPVEEQKKRPIKRLIWRQHAEVVDEKGCFC